MEEALLIAAGYVLGSLPWATGSRLPCAGPTSARSGAATSARPTSGGRSDGASASRSPARRRRKAPQRVCSGFVGERADSACSRARPRCRSLAPALSRLRPRRQGGGHDRRRRARPRAARRASAAAARVGPRLLSTRYASLASIGRRALAPALRAPFDALVAGARVHDRRRGCAIVLLHLPNMRTSCWGRGAPGGLPRAGGLSRRSEASRSSLRRLADAPASSRRSSPTVPNRSASTSWRESSRS